MKRPFRFRLEAIAFAENDAIKDIARAANISSTYASKIVNGHLVPSDNILRSLAAHYKVADFASLLDHIDSKTLRASALL